MPLITKCMDTYIQCTIIWWLLTLGQTPITLIERCMYIRSALLRVFAFFEYTERCFRVAREAAKFFFTAISIRHTLSLADIAHAILAFTKRCYSKKSPLPIRPRGKLWNWAGARQRRYKSGAREREQGVVRVRDIANKSHRFLSPCRRAQWRGNRVAYNRGFPIRSGSSSHPVTQPYIATIGRSP